MSIYRRAMIQAWANRLLSNIGPAFGHYLRDPLNSAFRSLWRRTLTNQGVFDDGLRFKYGRWNIRYHSFAEAQEGGFLNRGQTIKLESEIVDGWMLLYSNGTVDPPSPQDRGFGNLDVGVRRLPQPTQQQRDECGGKFINLPGFSTQYGGLWVATNPWRDRVCVCGVENSAKPVMRLRELAAILARGGKKKCRVEWVGDLLNWLEDKPVATELIMYASERTIPDQYDPTRDPARWRKGGRPSAKSKKIDGRWVKE